MMNQYEIYKRIDSSSDREKINSDDERNCYLVEENATKRIYILKKLNICHLTPSDRQRVINGSSLLRQMHHPNLIQHHDVFLDHQSLCIVMEVEDRMDLLREFQMRKKGKDPLSWIYMTEDEIMLTFLQLLLAVDYLHGQRFIHRDIESKNVFLCRDGIVKLGNIDFGQYGNNADRKSHYV